MRFLKEKEMNEITVKLKSPPVKAIQANYDGFISGKNGSSVEVKAGDWIVDKIMVLSDTEFWSKYDEI